MNTDFSPQLVSLAFRFYSRTLMYPYDELTHELQYLFREMEKNIQTDNDNTIASNILDIINFYQGEDMMALQAEFTRMFTPVEGTHAFIPVQISELVPGLDTNDLVDNLYESPLMLSLEDNPDSVPNVLDYFAGIIEAEDEDIETFFATYIQPAIPVFNEQVYRGSTQNFYKEVAKGLNELIILLDW